MKNLVLLLFLLQNTIAFSCDQKYAASQFLMKNIQNQWPEFLNNPYLNQTIDTTNHMIQILNNSEIVCAIKYTNEDKINYQIQNFENKQQAIESGFYVSHQGQCGACSSLQDLGVYMGQNLEVPVKQCNLKGAISKDMNVNCLKELGFTQSCAEIWYYDGRNTQKQCFWPCLWAFLTNEPGIINDNYNSCIQCDEDKSGTVFKYFAGRNRRNSGIISEIHRSIDIVYDVDQCYY